MTKEIQFWLDKNPRKLEENAGMINPLLHPFSSSAPTSPRITKSVAITQNGGLRAGLRRPRSPSGSNQPQNIRSRRLSRVVKCRTVDFTEFPEGMRDYGYGGKRKLREIQSQPGSPMIPRIEIHDFGSEVKKLL